MAEEKRKRPRLESHQSEISNLSTFTQSTQLSSDKSDESDETGATRVQGPRRVSNTSSQSVNHNKFSNPAASRKRTSSKSPKFKQDSKHASFYLEDEQEQNVFNFENVPQSYDNARPTKAQLTSRVRRNTDGDIYCGDRINHGIHKSDIDLSKYMHRSHTSSCWSMQKEQRMLSQQRPCDRQRQPGGASISDFNHEQYSHCACHQSTHFNTSHTPRQMVASVHGNQNSNTNVKTAIFHESHNALQSGNSENLKPIHGENTYTSIPSATDSAYVQVERGIRLHSQPGVRSGCPLSICDKSLAFYKRGFMVMCVMNIILILLNCIGLPFVYTLTQLQPPFTKPTTTPETPNAGSQISVNTFNKDVSCRSLQYIIGKSTYDKIKRKHLLKPNNDVCRIESTLDLIKIMKETTTYRLPNGSNPCIQCHPDHNATNKRFLMVAKPAMGTATGRFYDTYKDDKDGNQRLLQIPHTRMLWMQNVSPSSGFADITKDHRSLVTIPKTGNYFIFSRIHFKRKPQNQTMGFKFALGHSVVKVRPDKEDLALAEVSQKCFSSDNSAEHTSVLETVANLTKNDTLYVKLSRAEMFDETVRSHSLGMFFISN